jgi:hypothetical protein
LQETKMQFIARSTLISVLGAEFSEYVFLPWNGASGGILVAWKNHLRFTGASRVDNHSVSIQFHKQEGGTWWLTCVYGPQGDEEKISFLQELRNVREGCNGPWVVAGDFNLIYKASDKNNNNFSRAMMGRFRRLSALSMTSPLKKFLSMVGVLLGQINNWSPFWSGWTGSYAQLTGSFFSLMCCCRVLLPKTLIIAH